MSVSESDTLQYKQQTFSRCFCLMYFNLFVVIPHHAGADFFHEFILSGRSNFQSLGANGEVGQLHAKLFGFVKISRCV